ncbi:MAG TPA: DM13 domain-containing protein [Acidimicrobiia bacterium]|nr:DM13 domain-containing protein [Acidimicrobiia bacterium]
MRTSLAATARRFLRWEFIPEAVLFAGLTAFFVDQTDAATSAFKSTKAVAIMAVVGLGWLGARAALARLVRFAPARAAVFSVAAAVALAVVVVPAYDNDTVIESFPTAAAVSAPPEAPALPAATDTPLMPAPPAELAAPMATQPAPVAAQKKPTAAPTTSTTAPPAATVAETPTPTTTSPSQAEVAAPAAEPAPAPATSGPQRLRSGSFRGIDHRAEGTVVVYRQPDGRYVIGLEDIDIQPGPDYDLYLVPGEDREDTKGGVRLGDLRGNRGTQFYDVPAGVDLENGPWTVLVWCQTFAVPVANTTPS